jgi:hypothetical protein
LLRASFSQKSAEQFCGKVLWGTQLRVGFREVSCAPAEFEAARPASYLKAMLIQKLEEGNAPAGPSGLNTLLLWNEKIIESTATQS